MHIKDDENWILLSPSVRRKEDIRTYYGYIKTGEIKAENPVFYQPMSMKLAE